jgi:endonuclease/exonuclease/phosphatase family metal-dependent hydrolase
MKLKLLTYNLLFGKALPHAQELIDTENPDIVCVQELPTAEDKLDYLAKDPMERAGWTNTFVKFARIFGNAVYVNTERFACVSSRDEEMPSSTYDFVQYLTKGFSINRRFTETCFKLKDSGETFYVYNVHLTHLSFVDLRLAQLKKVFEHVRALGPDARVLIAGDFNLYNGKTELEMLMEQYGLREATNTLGYTFQHPLYFYMVKMKLDYVLYRGFTHTSTRRFDLNTSDHHAILSEFET